MKILLVEDEPKLNQYVRQGLAQHGYTVDTTTNGAEALELASGLAYDLIILDIMLPGQSGFEVLDNLKRFSIYTPVIMLSALTGTQHVIEGLDKGAVDYIKKPFDFSELLARIRVVARKNEPRQFTQLQVGTLHVDLLARKVEHRGQLVELTRREFMLLEFLLLHHNRILSKAEIAEKVWEIRFDNGSNVIEVHMSSLRKKLREDIIKTKVGVGYYVDGPVTRQ